MSVVAPSEAAERFVEKWRDVELSERAASHEHFIDLPPDGRAGRASGINSHVEQRESVLVFLRLRARAQLRPRATAGLASMPRRTVPPQPQLSEIFRFRFPLPSPVGALCAFASPFS